MQEINRAENSGKIQIPLKSKTSLIEAIQTAKNTGNLEGLVLKKHGPFWHGGFLESLIILFWSFLSLWTY